MRPYEKSIDSVWSEGSCVGIKRFLFLLTGGCERSLGDVMFWVGDLASFLGERLRFAFLIEGLSSGLRGFSFRFIKLFL